VELGGGEELGGGRNYCCIAGLEAACVRARVDLLRGCPLAVPLAASMASPNSLWLTLAQRS